MDSTHTRLYQIPGGLFLENAPVYIPEGSLWQENQTQNLVGTLRLKNIAPAVLQTVTVKLIPFNTIGALLGEGVFHTYTPAAEPNGIFGADVRIPLPQDACAFGAAVTEAVFADGTRWTPDTVRAWHVADEGYNPQAPTQKK